MIRLLELFGGIGACSKALERLGIDYEISDYVEIDKYAVSSYNAMHDTNFVPQDVALWNKDIEVDLVMHGSPCQDFSIAGHGAGGDEGSGTRSSLLYETVRIVSKLKPKYVIWENVKNVLSQKHVHNFQNYLDKMDDLGYRNYYEVLNAKDYGIPQNRERVFVVSVRKDIDKKFSFPPGKELTIRLKNMCEDADERFYLSDKMIEFFTKNSEAQKQNGNGFRFEPTDGNVVAKTITTRAGGRMDDNFIKDGSVIRKLTPKECWRLMGFDDEDFAKAEKVNSNTQLYKQAGNSIVVNVLEAILKNLMTDDVELAEGQMTIFDFI